MSKPATTGVFAKDQLKSIVERIERLEEEKKEISDGIKEVYAEAKANGFDTKTIRKCVKARKVEPADRQEQFTMFDLYWDALGHRAEEPMYAEVAALVSSDLGRDKVLEAFQKMVPLGAEVVFNFGKGDRVRIRRMDDGTGVIEPVEDEPAPKPETPRTAVKSPKGGATVLKLHEGGKTPVQSAADRAEAAAKAKAKRPKGEGAEPGDVKQPPDDSAERVLEDALSETDRPTEE